MCIYFLTLSLSLFLCTFRVYYAVYASRPSIYDEHFICAYLCALIQANRIRSIKRISNRECTAFRMTKKINNNNNNNIAREKIKTFIKILLFCFVHAACCCCIGIYADEWNRHFCCRCIFLPPLHGAHSFECARLFKKIFKFK